jgi:Tfp pilus assembly protein PilX
MNNRPHSFGLAQDRPNSLLPFGLAQDKRRRRGGIDQRGATALFLTVLILTAVTTITFAGSQIILANLRISRERYDSTRAYYAAETGAERILWEIRKKPLNPRAVCTNPPSKFCFDASGNFQNNDECADVSDVCQNSTVDKVVLNYGSQDASYKISYWFVDADNYLEATGEYLNAGRRIRLKY